MPYSLQLILIWTLAQTPALDSFSPRERSEAVEAMAVLGKPGCGAGPGRGLQE